ncbi:MAG: flavodoxin domain-containing protein [Candidatus Velamenicoccus archaeovorus]
MKALVVFESLYGNTATIGRAVAASLREHGLEVQDRLLSEIEPGATVGYDLLVVGGPTHTHGMSKPDTRRQAAEDAKNAFAERTVEPGLPDWLDRLPRGTGQLAAAFDTRIDKPAILTGSAAKHIAKRLRAHGYRALGDPESFFVTMRNELAEGETGHAATWGASLARRATESAAS